MSNNPAASKTRCLFFGMPCAFSTIILDTLREVDVELVGIVTPDRSPVPGRPVSSPKPFLALHQHRDNWLNSTPRFAVRSLQNPYVQETLLDTAPDLIVVACFPWLLPMPITSAASIAAVNIHPSLLPRWRGPEPLFWTFHAGDTTTGVTIHRLDERFDSGPILAQREVPILDGESLAALDRRLAMLGAAMLGDLVQALPGLPDDHQQVDSRATAAPVPDVMDRTFDESWTVERARRFIVGVAASHGPLYYRAADQTTLPIVSLNDDDGSARIALAGGSLAVTLVAQSKSLEPPSFDKNSARMR